MDSPLDRPDCVQLVHLVQRDKQNAPPDTDLWTSVITVRCRQDPREYEGRQKSQPTLRVKLTKP